MFVILQKYDFSSKSQLIMEISASNLRCLWYCKSTIFQANHNSISVGGLVLIDVCDTAKVRFFKQITTEHYIKFVVLVMFVILQKYDFSSKSQQNALGELLLYGCLWYCKSTIFQANHNAKVFPNTCLNDVCDTAKVRFFKQITTNRDIILIFLWMFVILQKYDFSSKSQHSFITWKFNNWCLWYCKSTIFQANHNKWIRGGVYFAMFVILQKYDFSSKSQPATLRAIRRPWCLWYCKSTIFQANHNKYEMVY